MGKKEGDRRKKRAGNSTGRKGVKDMKHWDGVRVLFSSMRNVMLHHCHYEILSMKFNTTVKSKFCMKINFFGFPQMLNLAIFPNPR